MFAFNKTRHTSFMWQIVTLRKRPFHFQIQRYASGEERGGLEEVESSTILVPLEGWFSSCQDTHQLHLLLVCKFFYLYFFFKIPEITWYRLALLFFLKRSDLIIISSHWCPSI
jgi:hypothetical protein